MEYPEALKKVQTNKVKDNFMVIELYYDKKIILPYKEGVTFLASLSNAEYLNEPYNEPHRITGVNRDILRSWIMSNKEYEQYKIAALLNLSIDDVKKFENETIN